MKSYLTVTGTIFALIVGAHVLRVFSEGTQLLRDPFWIGLTLLAAALSIWAWRLLASLRRVA